MSVGTSTAIGLAIAGIGAKTATDIYAAHKASSTAKTAAKIQTDAADKAQQQYDSIYSPYLTAGRTATSTLGRLVTPGPGATYAAADPTQPAASSMPSGPMPGGRPMPAGAPTTGMAQPRTLGGMVGQPPQASAGGGGMVLLEANDGSGARPVPASEAARFLQTGNFRRVG